MYMQLQLRTARDAVSGPLVGVQYHSNDVAKNVTNLSEAPAAARVCNG